MFDKILIANRGDSVRQDAAAMPERLASAASGDRAAGDRSV